MEEDDRAESTELAEELVDVARGSSLTVSLRAFGTAVRWLAEAHDHDLEAALAMVGDEARVTRRPLPKFESYGTVRKCCSVAY
jgi:hypothetical protein